MDSGGRTASGPDENETLRNPGRGKRERRHRFAAKHDNTRKKSVEDTIHDHRKSGRGKGGNGRTTNGGRGAGAVGACAPHVGLVVNATHG